MGGSLFTTFTLMNSECIHETVAIGNLKVCTKDVKR